MGLPECSPTFNNSHSEAQPQKSDRAARARTYLNPLLELVAVTLRITRRGSNGDDIVCNRIVDPHAVDLRAGGEDYFLRNELLLPLGRLRLRFFLATDQQHDLLFRFTIGISDVYVHEETVHLRLREADTFLPAR